MKAKEFLTKIIATNYSRPTMQWLFHAGGQDEERTEQIARLIDETGSEEELVWAVMRIGKGEAVMERDIGIFVMDYLQSIGLNMLTIIDAVDDSRVEQSYRLIMDNPRISKEEFLRIMDIEEEV